jgi:hypothetical protein
MANCGSHGCSLRDISIIQHCNSKPHSLLGQQHLQRRPHPNPYTLWPTRRERTNADPQNQLSLCSVDGAAPLPCQSFCPTLIFMTKRIFQLRSTLSDAELLNIESRVSKYLAKHDSIANREIRDMTGFGSDQVGQFLRTMIERGVLRKIGAYSHTRYTLP